MDRELKHDVVILGAGLAGLRAAVEISRRLEGKVDIGIVSKVQLMRAHSVCAEGGTAAVLRTDLGDSQELHAWDTVKGSDFLADQDVVRTFVETIPKEIRQLDHWGIPWTRDADGYIAQRPFGGHSYPRATLAADKTGFFEMQTLYDQLQRYRSFTRYDEFFVTDILVERRRASPAWSAWTPAAARPWRSAARRCSSPRAAAAPLRVHHLLADRHGRRHGDGLPGRPAARGHGVPAVPPDRPGAQRHPDDRGLPRRGRLPAEQHGRALHGEVRAQAHGARAARHGLARRDRGDPRRARLQDPRRAGLPRARPHPPRRGPHQHAAAADPRGDHQVPRARPDRRSRSRSARWPTTRWAASRPTSTGSRASPASGRRARRPACRCTAPTGWARTRPAECLVWGGITGRGDRGGAARAGRGRGAAGGRRPAAPRTTSGRCWRGAASENLYELRRQLRATMDSYVGVFRNGDDLAKALASDPRDPRRARSRRRSPTSRGSTTRTSSTPSSWRTSWTWPR